MKKSQPYFRSGKTAKVFSQRENREGISAARMEFLHTEKLSESFTLQFSETMFETVLWIDKRPLLLQLCVLLATDSGRIE